MQRFNRASLRLGLPIAIGLIVMAAVFSLIAAAPAHAIDQTAPIDSPQLDRTAQPTGSLIIPLGQPPTQLDGVCNPANEYKDALDLLFNDAFSTTGHVYLKHDNVNLYVCLQGVSTQNAQRFVSVYLDTLNSRKPFAGATDYSLRADFATGLRARLKGTDVPNGYVPTTLGGWTAATTTGNNDVAEYSIPLAMTGGWCGQPFGLAVYHHWLNFTGDDYGWPSNQFFDQPPTWTEVQLGSLAPCAGLSDIAYVYKYNTAAANDFKALLTAAGFAVDLIPQSAITATSFLTYYVIIVADDTGNLNTWGAGLSQVSPITDASKPILGIGEGGYAFFGQLASPIGWPNGWHGPQQFVVNESPVPASYYVDPHDLSGLLGAPIKLYQTLVNEVGIYVPGKPPAGVTVFGWELPITPQGQRGDHAPLINDGCYQLWGYSESPTRMTEEGRRLFINAVIYSRFHSRCAPPLPPVNCLTLTKTAVPPSGTPVNPGDVIKYTLSYTITDNAQCATQRSVLFDHVPDHSLFVPGSAGPGIVPNFDDTLIWDLGPLPTGAIGSKDFRVSVLDTACNRQATITNTAKLQTDKGVATSNTTTHPVTCPPVTFPNDQPPYAEDEIQIYPYPLVTGRPTQISARVRNLLAVSQTVTVTFMTSPNRFGIGIPFSAVPVPNNPRVITLGPFGVAEVQLDWTPISSGHYCIQIKVEGAGFAPIYTQRNLDVTEDLRPGVTDMLTFTVMNPTPATGDINLVVDNTCPGWAAVINPVTINGAIPGQIYTATLSVTPPISGVLGTACHIDVQGWIGDRLIGGIRKLDVPPVHLPPSNPPWLEKEISTIPTPPISGTVNQACIELQNPLGVSRQVTVTFSEAVFGAGIGFTPFATQTLNLPANSPLTKYCVNWTPIPSSSLHRCILVELNQAGFQTQRSQRNIDIVRRQPLFDPGTVIIPFSIGNPFPFPSKLDLQGILIGLNQWKPKFTGPGGGDPPPELGPNQVLNFNLQLVPAGQRAPQAAEATFSGDVVRVDVAVLLNDQPASGFSVEFAPPLTMYLPLILK